MSSRRRQCSSRPEFPAKSKRASLRRSVFLGQDVERERREGVDPGLFVHLAHEVCAAVPQGQKRGRLGAPPELALQALRKRLNPLQKGAAPVLLHLVAEISFGGDGVAALAEGANQVGFFFKGVVAQQPRVRITLPGEHFEVVPGALLAEEDVRLGPLRLRPLHELARDLHGWGGGGDPRFVLR